MLGYPTSTATVPSDLRNRGPHLLTSMTSLRGNRPSGNLALQNRARRLTGGKACEILPTMKKITGWRCER
jgi:hypothetical protein